jgi:hypothetical protein
MGNVRLVVDVRAVLACLQQCMSQTRMACIAQSAAHALAQTSFRNGTELGLLLCCLSTLGLH